MNQIIKGDILDVLKTLKSDSIDLGITSPPYNKGRKGSKIVPAVVYDKFDDDLPEEVYQEQQIQVLNELYRVIKPGGSFFYNHRCRWFDGELIHPMEWLSKTKWQPKQEIIWDRYISGQLRGWRFWQIDERIYWLYKPGKSKVGEELKSKHARMSSIWRFPPERNNPHPAPYPLVLPLRIIYSLFDDKKGTVIDPYIGSGTTAVAAKLLGCDYIGIDIKDHSNILSAQLPDVDLVIHLAGVGGVRQSLENPKHYWDNNVVATHKILKHYKDTRVLLASSSSQYEPWLNPYAASKHVIEYIPHPNVVAMRFHTVYSETPRLNMFFDKLLSNQLEYVTPHTRDFVHVNDVVEAMIVLMASDFKGPIDIGTGESVSVKDIAPNLPVREGMPGERPDTKADITKMKALGWKPTISVKEFLAKQGYENRL